MPRQKRIKSSEKQDFSGVKVSTREHWCKSRSLI